MPYASDAQRRWAHTESARRSDFPTEEFDREEKRKNMEDQVKIVDKKFAKKDTPELRRSYITRKGMSPHGAEYEKWLEKQTGGDWSDSGVKKAFGGDGGPAPLKKGEISLPAKKYAKEGAVEMKPMKSKSVEVGVSDKAKKAAVARVRANMAAEESRRKRKEPDIETY
jgi:hypothetical protein